ncbi:hypothetical protein CALVIDRAFT_567494 [Calocera viscosa TUFC12733]|uniref:FCP1 homology domain-containing protein n=1 Tax=Calocera viscosa (strain TUFC12733) TaxID=1330018 RepID=A0A167I3L5_CALVF|nr:hypothetical protein CALVIDRAFT_567494 [Calocera viscosa TUFC12733]
MDLLKPRWKERVSLYLLYTVVVDIDDLLVASTWDRQYGWRTAERPGVDDFLAYMSQFYEIVVFTTQYVYMRASSLFLHPSPTALTSPLHSPPSPS